MQRQMEQLLERTNHDRHCLDSTSVQVMKEKHKVKTDAIETHQTVQEILENVATATLESTATRLSAVRSLSRNIRPV